MFQVDSKKIRDSMFKKKLNIATLAKLAKLTEKTVASLLNGSKANAATIGKIADALDCNGEDLLLKEV